METTQQQSRTILSLPPLYKRNSKGSTQFWQISVVESGLNFDLVTKFGQIDGKIQTAIDTITEGKNLGKANETTIEQQAVAEAQSAWTFQIERKGYVDKLENIDVETRQGAEPMLAQRYDKNPEKIEFPCFIQPKLDGHRCIAIVEDGKCSLFSRTRTPITGVPHIVAAIEKLIPAGRLILDGELYNHAYKSRFEELTGFIRSEEPKEGFEVVQYHVYDLAVEDAPYFSRLQGLRQVEFTEPLIRVNTVGVNNDAEVLKIFREHRAAGYEGSMLRNMKGLYVGKRSYDLQKVKEFMDEEFTIIGVEEGRGKMKGHAIFVCTTKEGKEFRAKMKGTMESLAKYYQNGAALIGKQVTVMFQDYTSDRIPRFPVAIRLREDV